MARKTTTERKKPAGKIDPATALNLSDPFGLNGSAPKAPRKPPVDYTPELAALICEKLRTGQTLRSICMEPGMPTRVDVQVP